MKILIDGRLYGLENAGLGRYVMNLVTELSTIDSKNEYVLLLRKKYFDSLDLPNNWKKILADFHHYGFAEQGKLPALIKKENPDITHFPHFNVPLLYRGKYVVTIHDMLMHKSKGRQSTTLTAPWYIIKRLGYRSAFDNAVLHSAKIIVPSQVVKQEIIKSYKIPNSKIFVTYEGVNIKDSATRESSVKNPYFVYAGNAYPHKNLGKLIEAIVLLNKNTVQEVKLLIASSRGIFTQRLERLIQDQNASRFVELLGFVTDEKLYTLYKNSIGFVFPSLSEGFGLPGLEAMDSGTLVLASDIPVFREIYQENVIYFDPKDPESIKAVLEKALKMDARERMEKIKNAKDFVKRYSWAKMAKETLKIYKQSLAK